MVMPSVQLGDPPHPLRLLFNGHVVEGGGSSPGGFHLLLEALLCRGHHVTFVGKSRFVRPDRLLGEYENLRFVDATNSFSDAVAEHTKRVPLIGGATQIVNHRRFARHVVGAMRQLNRRKHFDAVLYLNLPAFGRVGDLPIVSWVQGAAGSDVRSLDRHAALLRQTEGRGRHAALRLYGRYRYTVGRPRYEHSDRIITGSSVSAAALQSEWRVPAERIMVLPIPVDVRRFPIRPLADGEPRQGPLEVLWLGRVVPRKRLDLLLDATALAIDRGVDIRLKIIGGFTFTPGLRELIGSFRHPDRLQFVPHVNRDEAAVALRRCDLLAQPSEEEDFGMSAAEAWCSGTPSLLGADNGMRDYACPQTRVVPDYRPNTWANALAEALQRKLTGSLMNPSATRCHAERQLDLRRIVDSVESLLRQMTGPILSPFPSTDTG